MSFARLAMHRTRSQDEEHIQPLTNVRTAVDAEADTNMLARVDAAPQVAATGSVSSENEADIPPTYTLIEPDPAPIYRAAAHSPPPPYIRDDASAEDSDISEPEAEAQDPPPQRPAPTLVRIPRSQNPFSRHYNPPARQQAQARANIVLTQTVVVDMAPGQLEAGEAGAQQQLRRVQRRQQPGRRPQRKCSKCGILTVVLFLVSVGLIIGGLAFSGGAIREAFGS
ncbi:hypothetical protein LTR85_007730 [Meristemomyces frigidus]|nr:hypothetical protein LTR85_007730 [Meristemomyces frigidus]